MKPRRNTPQRALVFDLVDGSYKHPTADELYMVARKQDPHISRGTVYRNLNILVDTGKIRKIPTPTGPDHYDCVRGGHYHFLCRKCKRMFDTDLPYDAALDETPDDLPGFRTESHQMLLVGLCPNCLEDKTDSAQ